MKVLRMSPEFVAVMLADFGYFTETIVEKVEELCGDTVELRLYSSWGNPPQIFPGEEEVDISVDKQGKIKLKEINYVSRR